MKEGDIVILDKGFNNSSEVTLILMRKYFSTVADASGSQWDVMTYRLSPKN